MLELKIHGRTWLVNMIPPGLNARLRRMEGAGDHPVRIAVEGVRQVLDGHADSHGMTSSEFRGWFASAGIATLVAAFRVITAWAQRHNEAWLEQAEGLQEES